MATWLQIFWQGRLPLWQHFWYWLVGVGFAVNMGFSLLGLLAYVITDSVKLWALLHFLPVPYNFLAAVGAWRSAETYDGARWHAIGAQAATVLIFFMYLFL